MRHSSVEVPNIYACATYMQGGGGLGGGHNTPWGSPGPMRYKNQCITFSLLSRGWAILRCSVKAPQEAPEGSSARSHEGGQPDTHSFLNI